MGTTARVAVATGGSTEGNYSMIVFTGWDYGCCGHQATKQKQQNIYYRLQVRGEKCPTFQANNNNQNQINQIIIKNKYIYNVDV